MSEPWVPSLSLEIEKEKSGGGVVGNGLLGLSVEEKLKPQFQSNPPAAASPAHWLAVVENAPSTSQRWLCSHRRARLTGAGSADSGLSCRCGWVQNDSSLHAAWALGN